MRPKSRVESRAYFLKHQREDHTLQVKNNETAFPCKIEYSNDETLEIKEEMIEDYGNSLKGDVKPNNNRKYQSGVFKKHQGKRKLKIQESKVESEKKYKCQKCARSYVKKGSLYNHIKYECDLTPQFKCKFCGRKFKRKFNMCKHISLVHQEAKSTASKRRYNCNKCSRCYSTLSALNRHKRTDHATIKLEFICDYCLHKSKQKAHLSFHITSQHLK